MNPNDVTTLLGSSNTFFDEMINSTPSCLKIINSEGKLLKMNPKGLDLIEADSEEEVILADVYDIVTEDFREAFIKFNEKICSGKKGTLKFQIKGLKGTVRWMETFAAPYELKNGTLAHIAITNDISDAVKNREEINMQAQALEEASRLASLGELSGAIAHEINNPLTILKSKIFQIKKKIENNNIDSLDQDLQLMDETVNRVARIVQGLNRFSRKPKENDFRIVSINELIKDLIGLSAEKIKMNRIEIDFEQSEEYEVKCNEIQLSQVFFNLFNNSIYAIKKLEQRWIKLKLLREDSFVKIIFTDSGEGIPAEIADKLMSPFFTTKPHGEGTGLGLSISRKIIAKHNGSFELNTQSPNTEFVIKLPL